MPTTQAQALEALAVIEAQGAADLVMPFIATEVACLRSFITSAAAEIEALKKDAGRYRWLRQRNRFGLNQMKVRGGRLAVYQYDGDPKQRSEEATLIHGEALDAAIDAALQHEQEG